MSFVKVIDVPDDKDLYIIGDIHGNYDFYKTTITELGITDDDVIISVGDLVDRGQYNALVLDEFLKKENRHMVLGNHEDMMIRAQSNNEWNAIWLHNGGNTTLNELNEDGVTQYCKLLSDIPYLIEVNHRGYKIGIAHAGIPHYTNIVDWEVIKYWTETSPEYRHELIWDRNAIEMARFDFQLDVPDKLVRTITGVDYVIHGHTGVPNKFQFGNRVWIDTQFRSNKFTVASMNNETKTMEFASVIVDDWGEGLGYRTERL